MGAWGTESFANDDAMDWVAELESAKDLSVVREALQAAADAIGYIEAPIGSVSLAAAEVVAALRGRPHPNLPVEVQEWVSVVGLRADPALVALAARAVTVVAEDPTRSELRELWDEAADEDRSDWQAGVAELRQRLA